MTSPSTAELLAFALELADEADQVTLPYFRGDADVRTKADGTLVTLAGRLHLAPGGRT